MARTFLLTFKDNEAAESFVRLMTQTEDTKVPDWNDHVNTLGIVLSACGKLDAMVARPTAYCKCPGSTAKGKMSEWKKTAKFGWFICPSCRKPALQVVSKFVKNHLAGMHDLLPELIAKIKDTEQAPRRLVSVTQERHPGSEVGLVQEHDISVDPLGPDEKHGYRATCTEHPDWEAEGDKSGIYVAIDAHTEGGVARGDV